ncbi:hypothetical protein ACFE04_026812 [Oxalis oulophora]
MRIYCLMCKKELPTCSLGQNVKKVRNITPTILKKFVMLFVRTWEGNDEVDGNFSGGSKWEQLLHFGRKTLTDINAKSLASKTRNRKRTQFLTHDKTSKSSRALTAVTSWRGRSLSIFEGIPCSVLGVYVFSFGETPAEYEKPFIRNI